MTDTLLEEDVGLAPREVIASQPDEGHVAGAKERYFLVLCQYGRASKHNPLAEIDVACVDFVKRRIAEAVRTSREQSEVDVWLESGGGQAHQAYKLVLVLREHFSRIRMVIPDYAKSAATLLAFGGDEIYMGRSAELGPVDAQIPHPDKERTRISALDIAGSLEAMSAVAVNIVVTGGGQIFQIVELERDATVNAMLDFAAAFMNPVVAKLDPSLVNRARRQLDVGREYARRLLAKFAFQREYLELTEDQQEIVQELASQFVDGYPDHGFVISAKEAQCRSIGVKDLQSYDWNAEVKLLHSFVDGARRTYVAFHDADGLRKELEDLANVMAGGNGHGNETESG